MTDAPPQQSAETTDATGQRLMVLSLAALGVVYGDIGTSPLYAIRECFHGEYGIAPTPANILGVLSLVFWSLLLIVSVKYLSFIMRADNHGEGGVIALTALLRPRGRRPLGATWVLVGMGLFAASLLYGDGMITPAISVLSAVEGLRTITPVFQPYIVPITMVILIGLFRLQRRGTGHVGVLFGPITLLWLITIGVLGLMSLWRRPDIAMAVSPIYGVRFLWNNHLHGFLVLGAVFLVVTGTEALYADMGHFGKRPIRWMWFTVVLPALFLNYFGQGALLLEHPEAAPHPFYAMAPDWFLVPLVMLATAATIIASQAVISGAFSLTRQAIQLGYLPRMQIIHTSSEEMGQIYIPQINTMLMLTTLALVLAFGSSSRLAAAYGVAVTTTMLITSMLFFAVATRCWRWHRLYAGCLVALFMIVDLAFFGANISKITHGAWFPLLIGAGAFLVMTTWDRGRAMVESKVYGQSPPLDEFLRELQAEPPTRIPGKAVYLAGSSAVAPSALLRNLRHNRSLHAEVGIMTLLTEDIPSVNRDHKVEVEKLETGFYRVVAHFGFIEEPSVPYVLALAREKGLPFELAEVSFFLGRERLMPARRPAMSAWRRQLFIFMSRNALGVSDYFHIPPEQVAELGAQIEI